MITPFEICCGDEMTPCTRGEAAGFEIRLYRCSVCEKYESTSNRMDGGNHWVGAMGEAIHEEKLRLLEALYAS